MGIFREFADIRENTISSRKNIFFSAKKSFRENENLKCPKMYGRIDTWANWRSDIVRFRCWSSARCNVHSHWLYIAYTQQKSPWLADVHPRCPTLKISNMASYFVQRGDSFVDSCPNKWKWDWVSLVATVGKDPKTGEAIKERVGSCFRKIIVSGSAWCTFCSKDVSYGSRGSCTLVDHMKTKLHRQAVASLQQNTLLPGKLTISSHSNPSENYSTNQDKDSKN